MVLTYEPSCSAGNYFDGSGCSAAPAGYYAPSGTTGTFYTCAYSVLAGASNCDAPSEAGCTAGEYYLDDGCVAVPYGYYNPTAGANILYYCATPEDVTGATSCSTAVDDVADDGTEVFRGYYYVESRDDDTESGGDDDLGSLCYSCGTCSSEAVISAGIEVLDSSAFQNCEGLVSVDFSLSYVGEIPSYAFYNCPSLTSVVFSDSIYSIGESAFAYSGLTSVELPSSLQFISSYAFQGCTSLQSVSFPSSIYYIGSSAFESNTALESVVLPAGLLTLGMSAFRYCYQLGSVTINALLAEIPMYAFFGCSSLATLNLGNATSISYGAFQSIGAASVEFPDTLETIAAYAFYGSSMPSATFNEGLTIISYDAFAYSALTSVTLPSSLTELGDQAFMGCYNLATVVINEGLTTIPSRAFMSSPVSDLQLSSTITGIYDYAFYGNSLESLVLPSNLTYIGSVVFYSDESTLAHVEFNEGLETIMNSAFTYCPLTGDLILPSTVSYVGDYAFFQNRFTSVTLPSRVSYLGSAAFMYGTEIQTLIWAADTGYISAYAFANCPSLTSVEFLSDVYVIGSYAFQASGLITFTAPEALAVIDGGAFYSSPSLSTVTLNKEQEIYSLAFCSCPSLLSVVIPFSRAYRAEDAFCSPTELVLQAGDDYYYRDDNYYENSSPTPSPTTFGVSGFDYGKEVNLTAATFTCMKSEGMDFFIPRGFFTTQSNKSFVDPYLCSHLRLARDAGITAKGIFVYPKPVSGLSPWWPLKSLKSELQKRCPAFADLRIWLTVRQDDDHHNWMHVKRNKAWFRDFVTSCKSNFNHCGIHTSQSSWESVFGSSSYFPDNIVGMPLWYQNVDSLANFQDYENSDNVLGGWSQPKVKQYDSMVTMCDATVGLDWLYQL
jgi:hypothetical protein